MAYDKIKGKINPQIRSSDLKELLFGLLFIATFGSFLVISVYLAILNLLLIGIRF